MKQEDKDLLLKDLCARLPYKTYVKTTKGIGYVYAINTSQLIELSVANDSEYWSEVFNIDEIKPYLRPMSSMTEEEAKELSILYGLKDILSIKIADGYIDAVVDDGFGSTEARTIWYDEIVSSIEIFDWLNTHHFDYRDLIPMGLAIAITKENNPYK